VALIPGGLLVGLAIEATHGQRGGLCASMLEGDREARRVLISFLKADFVDLSAREAIGTSELGLGGGGLML